MQTKEIKKVKVVLLLILLMVSLSLIITFVILSSRHTVSFNSNGGADVKSYNYVVNNSTITEPPTPQRDGYEFEGWYYKDKLFDFYNYRITNDITLIAHWSPINYKISYVYPKYSKNPNTEEFYNVEQSIFLRPAVAENLVFMGWYDNENRAYRKHI